MLRVREPNSEARYSATPIPTRPASTSSAQVDGKPPRQHAFAVNIDPAESDPATLTRQELQSRFGDRPLVYCENPDDLADTITRLREGTSLWELFLAAVLVGLVVEVFLANRGAGCRGR